MYLQSYLAHVRGQVGLSIHFPKLWSVGGGGGGGGDEWLISSLRLASSMLHDEIK